MTARERILALKLLAMQKKHPECAKRIGIQVNLISKDPKQVEEKNV